MTDEERARELCPCTCYAYTAPAPDGRGPLKDGSHFANCPSENWPDIAAALAAERERCAEACADVMRMHRADRQAIDARPDGAAEDWEAYQCIEAAENAAKECHAAIHALGDER